LLLLLPQVVVPVRETCAQALGAALQPLDIPSLRKVLQLLSSCYQWGATQRQWHVRHGGFTGIKYLLASRPDAAQQLLPEAMPLLLQGLQDGEDSVQAAAADALVPMAGLLGEVVPEVGLWCGCGTSAVPSLCVVRILRCFMGYQCHAQGGRSCPV
jgi:HEAT repeat protein